MTEKILVVDDEQNLLNAIYRQLRKSFHIDTALGPEQGLTAVENKGPYAVVISDLRMPAMDGIQFLARVKQINPETVRMMLSGNTDLEMTIQAVNEGNIFRFFTKPCPPEILAGGLRSGIEQYQLVTAERELLQKTLKGSIKVLSEVLSLVNPEAFGRASRIRRYVRQIASELGVAAMWQVELAAMLSQIGCIVLPEETIRKVNQGRKLTAEAARLYESHPLIAFNLISNIPRLEKVAEIIRYQEKHFDGSGIPADSRKGESIPLGARILKVANDFDLLTARDLPKIKAFHKLREQSCCYDPKILDALRTFIDKEAVYFVKDITVSELDVYMIIEEDIRTKDGQLVIAKGHEVGPMMLDRLKSFARTRGIKEPIRVQIPADA